MGIWLELLKVQENLKKLSEKRQGGWRKESAENPSYLDD